MALAWLFVLASLVTSLVASEATSVVIPHDEHAPLERDLIPALRAYYHATLSAALAGTPDSKGKPETLAALALAERRFSDAHDVLAEQVRQAAYVALSAGSQDAMMAYLSVSMSDLSAEKQLECYRDVFPMFDDAPYPRVRRFYCGLCVMECIDQMTPRRDDAYQSARGYAMTDLFDFLATVDDGDRGAEAANAESFAAVLGNKHWLRMGGSEPLQRLNEEWVLHKFVEKGCPPWWSDYLQGVIHTSMAWVYRGSGYADTVTAEGWVGFSQQLKLARTHLVAAWKRHPDRPEAARKMIPVAMGGEVEDGDVYTWFNRAVAAQMDDLDAYQALMYAILPRWGGSYQQVLAVGEAAADTGRFDTQVPMELLEAVGNIYEDAKDLNNPPPAILTPALYAQCLAVITAYRPLHPELSATYDTKLAAMAWMCGKPDECRCRLDAAVFPDEAETQRYLKQTPQQLLVRAGGSDLNP